MSRKPPRFARIDWDAATDSAVWELVGCSVWDLAATWRDSPRPFVDSPLLDHLHGEGLSPDQAAAKINELSAVHN